MTTTSHNPWVPQPVAEAVDAVVESTALPRATGPTAPQLAASPPPPEHCLPVVARPGDSAVVSWWLGVHGGAGESALAHLDPGTRAADHAWPQTPNPPDAVTLVARTTVPGLLAAQRAAIQWAAGLVPHVNLLGLVLIADIKGRLPRPIRDLQQLITGGVPHVWHLPWDEGWRLGQPPELHSAPRQIRRVLEQIHALAVTPLP